MKHSTYTPVSLAEVIEVVRGHAGCNFDGLMGQLLRRPLGPPYRADLISLLRSADPTRLEVRRGALGARWTNPDDVDVVLTRLSSPEYATFYLGRAEQSGKWLQPEDIMRVVSRFPGISRHELHAIVGVPCDYTTLTECLEYCEDDVLVARYKDAVCIYPKEAEATYKLAKSLSDRCFNGYRPLNMVRCNKTSPLGRVISIDSCGNAEIQWESGAWETLSTTALVPEDMSLPDECPKATDPDAPCARKPWPNDGSCCRTSK
jgi:hypothetical protein